MQIGSLLGLKTLRVGCTIMRHETDIFGPKVPYIGGERGNTLNNFLAEKNGDRCIVFLDEFEKTMTSVRQVLLLPLDPGIYVDRRNLREVDC
jgi:ATP-dependent Clp protease ATP-binding subunit ClpA